MLPKDITMSHDSIENRVCAVFNCNYQLLRRHFSWTRAWLSNVAAAAVGGDRLSGIHRLLRVEARVSKTADYLWDLS